MPIYEYRCDNCGHELESIQKLSEAPLKTCPACNEETLRKKVSAAGFRLKGAGWYETDFKGGGNKRNVAGDRSSSEGSSGKEASSGGKAEASGGKDKGSESSSGKSGGESSKSGGASAAGGSTKAKAAD